MKNARISLGAARGSAASSLSEDARRLRVIEERDRLGVGDLAALDHRQRLAEGDLDDLDVLVVVDAAARRPSGRVAP